MISKLSLINFLLLILCLFISTQAFSQRGKSSILRYDTALYAGQIVLTDGVEISGQIIFNDKEGIVTVVEGDESKSYNSRSLLKFEFYSRALQRQRVFYSLEYQDPDKGMKDMEFFELLGEFKSFAVLSKIDRIKTEAQRGPVDPVTSPLLVDRRSKKFIHSETIFFVNNQGEFEPYLTIFEKEIGGDLLDINERHEKYKDGDLFEKYAGTKYPILVEYAKQNELSFKNKEHIIILLKEFERLTL